MCTFAPFPVAVQIIGQPSTSLRRGFTLVEILVVVTILGIVGALVGTQLGSRDDLRAEAAARVLAANLQYAQNLALSRREAHYVIIPADHSQVTIMTRDTALNMWVEVEHPIDRTALGMTFGRNGTGGGADTDLVSFDFAGASVLGFDATGEPFTCAADSSSPEALTSLASLVLRSGSHERLVEVQPVTGEVALP